MKKAILVCMMLLLVFSINAGQDTIRNLLNDFTKAYIDIPQTKDANAVLKYFSTNYICIDDGELSTYNDLKKDIDFLIEQINLGNPLRYTVKISNLVVHSNWATYECEIKTAVGGELLSYGKCVSTVIFEKVGGNWVIRHEHNSVTFYEEYE